MEPEVPKRAETPVEEPKEEEQVDEPDVAPVPVEEEAVVEVAPVVVEEAKQSSSEATPTKKSKGKKNKIKIEEVIEQEPVVQEQPEPVVTKKPTAPPKKANKKAKDQEPPKITSFEDIQNLVVKAPLDDFEIQNIIDSLLSKQTGTGVQESWVEASKENETKALQRQLADKDALLMEENGKVKSLTEKMALLR